MTKINNNTDNDIECYQRVQVREYPSPLCGWSKVPTDIAGLNQVWTKRQDSRS